MISNRSSALCFFSVAALLLLQSNGGRAESSQTFTVSGHVLGSSGKHEVYVALWNAEGFLGKPAQSLRIAAGTDTAFRFVVTPGRWAVSAFEDLNGNGALDQGMFGPKEPSGFWRAFSGWHKPGFDEVASLVDKDIANADITLK